MIDNQTRLSLGLVRLRSPQVARDTAVNVKYAPVASATNRGGPAKHFGRQLIRKQATKFDNMRL